MLLKFRAVGASVLCWLALLLIDIPPITAATINVTTSNDVVGNDGKCSLREAVISSNTNSPSGDTQGGCPSGSSTNSDIINLPPGLYQLSTPPGSEGPSDLDATVGDLDLVGDLSIVGSGIASTIIDATSLSRVVHIDNSAATIHLSGIELRNGASSDEGGGIYISRASGIELSSVRVFNNSAQSGGGGGIHAQRTSTISIVDSEIVGNTTTGGGGGIFWATGDQLILERVRVEGNATIGGFASSGAGILALGFSSDSLIVRDSTIHGNISDDRAGGIWVDCALFMKGSTVSMNQADDDGGGIYFDFPGSSSIENSTISGNSAGSEGGAIWIISNSQVTITHTTIASNSATQGTAIADGDDISLRNSIVAGSCSGAFPTSLGGNIESPGDSCGFMGPLDQVAVSNGDLQLSSLQDNGGETTTHLPGQQSAALDTASSGGCLPDDQRDVARPQGTGCDVGSVERSTPLFADGFESGDTSLWT